MKKVGAAALVAVMVTAGVAGAGGPRTRLGSKNAGGGPADGDSYNPSISGAGRFVAFDSSATNLPGDDAYSDVYVHDRRTGRTRLVSKTSGGDPATGDSYGPSISAKGRFVAFE